MLTLTIAHFLPQFRTDPYGELRSGRQMWRGKKRATSESLRASILSHAMPVPIDIKLPPGSPLMPAGTTTPA
jgi:hypothetical protein